MFNPAQKKLLLLSSLGGVLEFYDFIIYALLASYIAKDFFPASNNMTSLIATFATFSVGYLVRPLGGVIFGHFGDKFGRKKTFTFSILMMALATLCISIVPSYAKIGIAAPIILTILRILQGLSVSGEIPGAIAYVSESMPEKKGLACSIVFFALINGIVLGSLILAILQTLLSTDHMLAWGWRIPFLMGGIFGIFSYFMRRQLEEPKMFVDMEHNVLAAPIVEVFKKKPLNCLLGSFINGANAAAITLLFLFMPSYVSNVLKIHSTMYVWWNTFAIFLATVLCVLIGKIADKMNLKKLCWIATFLTMLFAYPIFIIYTHYFSIYLIALLLSAILVGIYSAAVPGLLPELFETSYRYSGIAASFNLGFAVFGGLTPLIAMMLISKTGSALSPAIYLMGTSLLASIALIYVKARKLR